MSISGKPTSATQAAGSAPALFDLNGIRMTTAMPDAGGAVTAATEFVFEQVNTFVFEQVNTMVSARYRGGAIVDAYLIRHLRGASLHFRYVQADCDGRLDAGVSNGIVERLVDGRLRLVEHFQ